MAKGVRRSLQFRYRLFARWDEERLIGEYSSLESLSRAMSAHCRKHSKDVGITMQGFTIQRFATKAEPQPETGQAPAAPYVD
jgi:hypothetical protein